MWTTLWSHVLIKRYIVTIALIQILQCVTISYCSAVCIQLAAKTRLPCSSDQKVPVMHSTDPPLWHISARLAQANAFVQQWIVQYLFTDLAQQVYACQAPVGTFLCDRLDVRTRRLMNCKHIYLTSSHNWNGNY